MAYERNAERFYRSSYRGELQTCQLAVGETDLAICLVPGVWEPGLEAETLALVAGLRRELEDYISSCPEFARTHSPFQPPLPAPEFALCMARASTRAGVGPMAAVAGAFSQAVGRFLWTRSAEVLVENGGDLWLAGTRSRRVGIFAGDSPFSGRLALNILPQQMPLGICTSSGTVGPSFSYGTADAVTVLAPDALLADAVATAAGNLVQSPADLQRAVEFAVAIEGVTGAVAIKGASLAAQGDVELAGPA